MVEKLPGRRDIYSYTVRGSGPFPLDMLRYDSSWPATPDDVIAMMEIHWKRDVKLLAAAHPTKGRWESFLWRILED